MAITRNIPWPPLMALLAGVAAHVALGAVPAASQPLPTPFPENRYQQMSARSPFAVATAAAAPAATPGFATQLYVDGVARNGNSEFVAIKSRDPEQTNVLFLEVGTTSPDGIKVERVTWSDEPGKSTVDVSKGGEKATLLFDEATLKLASNNSPMAGPQIVRLPVMPGQPRPMNFPMQNGQTSQFNNRFFQPGQVAAGPNQMTPAAIDQIRRRIRGQIIPSGQ